MSGNINITVYNSKAAQLAAERAELAAKKTDLATDNLFDPVPPGISSNPALIPNGPPDRKAKFEPEPGFYQGFPEVTPDKRWYFYWDKISWSLYKLGDLPKNLAIGNIELGDTEAVNGGKVFDFVTSRIDETPEKELLAFADESGAVYGYVDENGKFSINLTDEAANEVNHTKFDDHDFLEVFQDTNGNVYGYVDKNGVFNIKIAEDDKLNVSTVKTGELTIANIGTKKQRIVLSSIAVGRSSTATANDAPRVTLTDSGYTHPKVLFIKNGFAGYKYWMAITPTFGPIATQPSPAFFENPHIFCSNDGVTWSEPTGGNNPLDVTAPLSTGAAYPFWSDTHLLLGDDGYLYCYYRGVDMPKSYINGTGSGIYAVVVVCRKSRDGLNWSDREVVFTSEANGVDDDSQQLSPAFEKYGSQVHCYDVIKTTTANPISPDGVQSRAFVVRRSSQLPNGGFSDYSKDRIVRFLNNPFPSDYDVWHLDATHIDGCWFLLLNMGVVDSSMGQHLYLAYSYDGWNFKVLESPVYKGNTYRSSITPMSSNGDYINFFIYRSDTTDGHLDLLELQIKKK